jgi:NACHT domain
MSRLGRWVAVAVLVVGFPVFAVSRWGAAPGPSRFAAILAAVGWELLLAIGWVISKIAAGPLARRMDEIGDFLDRALGMHMSRYGRRYRQWVLESRRFMESKGLATVGEVTPELDDVYVDVGLVPSVPHRIPLGVLDAPLETGDRRSIWHFLMLQGPAVVLAVIGAPGSGKTTLLSHIARHVATTPNQRRRPVPVLLQLRDHARQVAADPDITLPRLIRRTLPSFDMQEPAGWWEHKLSRGKCVVLLDGLDEVGNETERREVASWVNRQISVYPTNDYVLTSRPHGYRTAVIESAMVLQVRPFTHEQVKRFLHGWYLAVDRRSTGSAGPEVEARAREAADDLLDRLAATPALYDLTINPLLLAMIANVHRYRGMLPGSRADLYGEMCQVMLWRRQEAKKLTPVLQGTSKERLLAGLAFLMMNERVRDLPYRRVIECIEPGLQRLTTTMTPEGFVADVVTNGLLVERERGLYAYAHLTFQEFLAAKYIKEHDLGGMLTETVEDAWWRETTLLYVAGADADGIVRSCLRAATPAAVSLAFDCM